MPNIREAALQLLTTFAIKAGSMKPVDRVGTHRSLDNTCALHAPRMKEVVGASTAQSYCIAVIREKCWL